MLVFSQKFRASSLFGSTITCITLTNCTDNLFGDPGSTFPLNLAARNNLDVHVKSLPNLRACQVSRKLRSLNSLAAILDAWRIEKLRRRPLRRPKLRQTARRGHSITHASFRIDATPFFLPQKLVRPWPYHCRRPCVALLFDEVAKSFDQKKKSKTGESTSSLY